MVNIKVFIEGAVLDTQNYSAQTMNNVNGFREAFNLLFVSLGVEQPKITIEPSGGYKSAFKRFLKDSNSFLLVDLDNSESEKLGWFNKLEDEMKFDNSNFSIEEHHKSRVFFMIQEMEAWFLSQPEQLDRWGSKKMGFERIKPNDRIANDSNLLGIDPETITKPSQKLKTILGRYFRDNKKKKVKYGKLKHAPGILKSLDSSALIASFTDLNELVSVIKAVTSTTMP